MTFRILNLVSSADYIASNKNGTLSVMFVSERGDLDVVYVATPVFGQTC
jgi:hypothetical protein